MAGGAQIGALRVNLGLDSAQFSAGLKNAQSGLARFGKAAGVGLAAVATAAAAAGAALGYAVKGAIDHADELGKTAQKIGVTVEALSRLEYAAKLSDVSLDGLAGGLKKLSVNLVGVAQGSGGTAKAAFAALGISVTDAAGRMKSSDVVFAEVAERFARMEDGSVKTALAVALFGKAGADLIPLLNAGKEGLAAYGAESDRLGNTISTKAAKAAEEFNDSLTELAAVFQGVVNKIMESVLPTLQAFADWLKTLSPEVLAWGTTLSTAALAVAAFGVAASAAAPGIALLAGSIGALTTSLAALVAIPGALALLTGGLFLGSTTPVGAGEDAAVRKMTERFEAMKKLREAMSGGEMSAPDKGFFSGIYGPGNTPFTPVITDIKAASAAAGELKKVMAEGKSVFEATRTDAEKYSIEIERLNGLLAAGAINQDTYNRAVLQAQDSFDVTRQSANEAGDAMSDAFKDLAKDAFHGKLGIDSVADALGNVGDKLLDIGLNLLLGGLTGGMGGGGGGLGSLLSGLFGFKDGGSFRVGGAGGVDSQLVAFKATPNERVTVSKNGEGDFRGAMTVHVSLDSNLLRAVVTDEAGRVVGQAAPTIVGAANASAPGALARHQQQRAGGDYRT